MNSFLYMLLKYLVFISGKSLKQVDAESIHDSISDYKMFDNTTAKSSHTTAEYYDYEHDTAPTITPRTVSTTTEEITKEYEYEETTVSFKDYVTDFMGELITKRLSRKKKRKKYSPYLKIGKDFDMDMLPTVRITTEQILSEELENQTRVAIPPTRNRTRVPKTMDVIEVPDPKFHLLYPAGFAVVVYDTDTVWPVMILWTINKNDVSKEISSIRGFFLMNSDLGKWVHDNEEQTFSKNDVFRFMIKYGYQKSIAVVEHFRRYYTINISTHYGRYFDMAAAQSRVVREKNFLKDKDREAHILGIMQLRATPVDIHMPPKAIFVHDLKRSVRRGRGRNAKRMALIRRIERAKKKLGITESTFISENVTKPRFLRYYAVDAYHGGFGYLRSQLRLSVFRLTTRSKRQRFKERPINVQLANRLGIRIPATRVIDKGKKSKKDRFSKMNRRSRKR